MVLSSYLSGLIVIPFTLLYVRILHIVEQYSPLIREACIPLLRK